MTKNSLSLIILFVLISSCNKSFDTKDKMNTYIQDEENGYTKSKKINGIDVSLTFKPSNLVSWQEFSNYKYSKTKKDSLNKVYSKYLYFVLSLSKNSNEIFSTFPKSREELNAIQNTLTFEMNKKVSLTNSNKDTIPLIDFNSPRTYGMAKSTNVLLIFKKNELIENSDEFYFNMSDIGLGIGDVKFKYDETIKKQICINF
ncbi:hypothetical protein ACNQGB_02190 [Flavobacterium sp. XS1P32]|uniref:hypothetical protein n=1 Tax=Flavobacterium sp. XS1P32 TaxID=3401726 RepID=UPI003AAE531E